MRALITGITGQDGAYLSDLLLSNGYDVYGLKRRSSADSTHRLRKILGNRFSKINLIDGDITDYTSVLNACTISRPDEIYNLAAQSFVGCSFTQPEFTYTANALGIVKVIEATLALKQKPRIYQASSSEMFGNSLPPQNENTPLAPRSPYGVSKVAAYWSTVIYREAQGVDVRNGILFNHESPIRGDEFVTTKVIKGLIAIKNGKLDRLKLGNLNSKRDWGHAKDYVRAMYLIMRHHKPEDFVISMCCQHTIRDMVTIAGKILGMDIEWTGEGLDEVGVWKGREVIEICPTQFRPAEVNSLLGDSTKARTVLGWKPKYSFTDMLADMIEEYKCC